MSHAAQSTALQHHHVSSYQVSLQRLVIACFVWNVKKLKLGSNPHAQRRSHGINDWKWKRNFSIGKLNVRQPSWQRRTESALSRRRSRRKNGSRLSSFASIGWPYT